MSQQDHLDLLDSIVGWDAAKCRENVDSILPEMLMKLKDSTFIGEGIGVLQVICKNLVPAVPLEEVDDRIFSRISLPIRSLVKDVLNKVHLNVEGPLKDTVEELKDVIVECLQWLACILESVETCLQQVQLASIIPFSCIHSLPACAIGVLTQTYQHCKESSNLYGNLLDDLGEPLSAIFKKAHSLQVSLLSLLDKTSVPNSGLEEHVKVLCKVCNGLFEVCKVVTSLDIKLVVGLWKSISRLCSQNQSLLRDRLDVSPLICYLCDELTSGYSYLFQLCPSANGESLSQGDKTFTKCLKVQEFQMKVLVALLRDFVDYLGPCEQHILKLLLYILRCLPPSLSALSVSESQESEIRGQVANAVVPVLQHLVTNRAFRIYLTSNIGDQNVEDHLPLLLLQLNVLDLLPKCDADVVDCWLSQADHDSHSPTQNLIMAVFQSVEKCYVEMRFPVMLPGPMVEGKPQSQVSLYHHVAIHLCGFIGACSVRHFTILECSLLETVFGKDELCSLLATDCWCFLARYGSASLCYNHIKALLQAVQSSVKSSVKEQSSNITQSRLLYLLRRLIKFLSPEHQASLVDLYAPEHNLDLWLTLTLTPFCDKVQGVLGKKFTSFALRILNAETGKANEVFQALDCLNQLLSNSSVLSSCIDQAQQAILLDAVTQLWANQLSAPEDLRPIRDMLLVKLLPVTKYFLSSMETENILQMIQVLQSVLLKTMPSSNPMLLLSCAEFMESLASCNVQPPSVERDELLTTIPKLFYHLMTHSHPLVQTKALSSFGYFASHTPHEECIPSCLQSDSGLKTRLNNYLNKVPHSVHEDPFDTLEYLRQQVKQIKDDNVLANDNHDVTDLCCEDKNNENVMGDITINVERTRTGSEKIKSDSNSALELDADPPAKRPKLEESTRILEQNQETATETISTTPTTSRTFQNVLERLKAAADDLESICSSNGTTPPRDFIDQARIVLSRINDFVAEPSSWFDSLS